MQLIFLCWPYYWGFIGLADNRGVSVVCFCFSLCPRSFLLLSYCAGHDAGVVPDLGGSTQPFTMKCDKVLSLLSLAEFYWLLFWGCWWRILACTFICLEIFVRFGRWVEKHFPSLVSESLCNFFWTVHHWKPLGLQFSLCKVLFEYYWFSFCNRLRLFGCFIS